ncbi:MAG: A/G-specific adenine glycosylase [Candidatus Nitrosocaldaceae archaeon]|nr:MAG: A/G-specific adenine glycosylase [Candidatus Nitrosocaldaceae archaeon]
MDIDICRDVEAKKDYIVRAVLNWGLKNVRDFPWRSDRTPYKVLVAEIILRRTTAKAACKVYGLFIKRYPDIYTLSRSNVKDLEEVLSAVGYHKRRALILKEVAGFIVSKYEGVIPATKEELLSIPHIGQYIAGAILSLGYGIPAPMVDSNVYRIICRLFSKKLPDKRRSRLANEIAEAVLPKEGHELFNFAMLDIGSLICRYNKTLCNECPLRAVCDTAELPTTT